MKRRLLCVGAWIAAGALAGCTSLPTSSSPTSFDVSVPHAAPLDLAAGGPVADSPAETLVHDFLLACAAGASDDYTTARLFVTSGSARMWNPGKQVKIYATDSTPTVTITSDPTSDQARIVTVSAPAVATVDSAGIMTPSEGSRVETRYRLVRESGQWRIESPEDGVIVSQASFTASYELGQLYFPAVTGDALVADPRWYPTRRLATRLIEGLLEGPSEHVAPAVTNAIPSGSTLPSQGIEISDRRALVNLNAAVPRDEHTRRLMAWQIEQTLTRTAEISSVELSVGGEKIDTSQLPSTPTYSLDSAVGMGNSGLVELVGNAVTPLASGRVPASNASLPASSPLGSGLYAWREEGNLVLSDTGTGVSTVVEGAGRAVAPSIDRCGWVWNAGNSGVLTAYRADGTRVQVVSKNQVLTDIEAIRLSPDGARALLVRSVGGVRSAWLAAVQRQAHGEPVGLGDAEQIGVLSSGVVDVSWVGRSTIVAIRRSGQPHVGSGAVAADEGVLVTLPLGGLPAYSTLPQDASALSAGSSASVMIVRAREGYQLRVGAGWQPLVGAVRDLSYPG